MVSKKELLPTVVGAAFFAHGLRFCFYHPFHHGMGDDRAATNAASAISPSSPRAMIRTAAHQSCQAMPFCGLSTRHNIYDPCLALILLLVALQLDLYVTQAALVGGDPAGQEREGWIVDGIPRRCLGVGSTVAPALNHIPVWDVVSEGLEQRDG